MGMVTVVPAVAMGLLLPLQRRLLIKMRRMPPLLLRVLLRIRVMRQWLPLWVFLLLLVVAVVAMVRTVTQKTMLRTMGAAVQSAVHRHRNQIPRRPPPAAAAVHRNRHQQRLHPPRRLLLLKPCESKLETSRKPTGIL